MRENLPQRKSNRLQGYDYSQNGAYFVTVCVQDRCNILSDINNGRIVLYPIGKIAEDELKGLSRRYNVLIDKYVVMPNHVHMIIVIQQPVGAGLCSARETVDLQQVVKAEQSPMPAISDIVCAYKSITTKKANQYDNLPGRRIWQRSFYDHIIRNEAGYQKICQYIDENPMNWEKDCFYEPTCNQHE